MKQSITSNTPSAASTHLRLSLRRRMHSIRVNRLRDPNTLDCLHDLSPGPTDVTVPAQTHKKVTAGCRTPAN